LTYGTINNDNNVNGRTRGRTDGQRAAGGTIGKHNASAAYCWRRCKEISSDDMTDQNHWSLSAAIFCRATHTLWQFCTSDRLLVSILKQKSPMGFRLVPKSVTLNDLERLNGQSGWI